MLKSGMLVQMYSSQHQWIKGIKRTLLDYCYIDDEDYISYTEFHPSNSTKLNMQVIKKYI